MTGHRTIADEFWKIYDQEWHTAKQSLSTSKHEEEIIYLLMSIIRTGYEFCLDNAKDGAKPHSKDEIVQAFVDHHVNKSLHMDQLPKHVVNFAKHSVECLLKMVSHENMLSIHWVPKGDIVDSNMFQFDGDKSGHVCDWTVWPAVVDSKGHVLRKGVVIPV